MPWDLQRRNRWNGLKWHRANQAIPKLRPNRWRKSRNSERRLTSSLMRLSGWIWTSSVWTTKYSRKKRRRRRILKRKRMKRSKRRRRFGCTRSTVMCRQRGKPRVPRLMMCLPQLQRRQRPPQRLLFRAARCSSIPLPGTPNYHRPALLISLLRHRRLRTAPCLQCWGWTILAWTPLLLSSPRELLPSVCVRNRWRSSVQPVSLCCLCLRVSLISIVQSVRQ